jgi:hypothetical protein
VNRWGLFLLLFWTVPFPLFGLEGLAVPTARFVQLAASLSVLVVLEGAGGMVGPMLALLCVHSVIYSVILYVGSVVVDRWVARSTTKANYMIENIEYSNLSKVFPVRTKLGILRRPRLLLNSK